MKTDISHGTSMTLESLQQLTSCQIPQLQEKEEEEKNLETYDRCIVVVVLWFMLGVIGCRVMADHCCSITAA